MLSNVRVHMLWWCSAIVGKLISAKACWYSSFLGVFFLAMKFLVTFAIFAEFFFFCKQFLLNIFLLKLREKFVSKVFLQFAILVDFVIFAICHFFYSFLTVRLIFLLPKLRKQFATKFLLQCSILDIRGEPKGSHYATLSTISMTQIVQ